MMQFYKINNDINKVNWIRPYCNPDQLEATSGQRSSSCVQRENFFANRVNEWNKLPAAAISAETVNQLKSQLDKWCPVTLHASVRQSEI